MEIKGSRKIREGVVVKNKMEKTVTVMVERVFAHPRYKKVIRRGKKYYAHHEKGELEVGTRVRIRETRPLSKLKRWMVVGVVNEKGEKLSASE